MVDSGGWWAAGLTFCWSLFRSSLKKNSPTNCFNLTHLLSTSFKIRETTHSYHGCTTPTSTHSETTRLDPG